MTALLVSIAIIAVFRAEAKDYGKGVFKWVVFGLVSFWVSFGLPLLIIVELVPNPNETMGIAIISIGGLIFFGIGLWVCKKVFDQIKLK